MPKYQQKNAASRQRPISCRLCRVRKLRCSRTVPCTNCVSRNVACDLEFPNVLPNSTAGSSLNSEILERLRRLESLLTTQQEHGCGGRQPLNITKSRLHFARPSSSPPQVEGPHAAREFLGLEGRNVNSSIPVGQNSKQESNYA
jgi:hypothetical protein